jgi:pectate lyase C
MKSIFFLGAVVLLTSATAFAANRPSGYQTICTTTKPNCSVISATNVAFGRNGRFTYKILSGNFICDEITFGAGTKVPGGINECSIPKNQSSSSSSSSSSYSSSQMSSSSSSSSSSVANSEITGGTCVSTGVVNITETVLVTSGVYDGQCKTFIPPSWMNTGSHSETEASRSVVFRVENGATLKNVIIGDSKLPVDGINVINGGTLDNITMLDLDDVGIRARITTGVTTIPTVNVSRLSVEKGGEGSRVFQINNITNLNVSNCIAKGGARFLRQNGGQTFVLRAKIDRCEISDFTEAVLHADSTASTAELTNSRLHNTPTICRGTWRSCTSSNISYF